MFLCLSVCTTVPYFEKAARTTQQSVPHGSLGSLVSDAKDLGESPL